MKIQWSYYKIIFFMIAVLSLQAYGVYCEQHNVSTILNATWFKISFWAMCIQGLLCALFFFPTFFSTTEDEYQNFIKAFGETKISKLVTEVPFILFIVYFIQWGEFWKAVLTIPVLLFTWAVCATQKDATEFFLNKAAKEGTKK